MRSLALVLAACGGSHSAGKPDAPRDSLACNGCDAPNLGDGSARHPTTITVTLVNHPNTPATFAFVAAYQDGAGAWQVAPPPNGDVYTFGVSSSAWGFAWTCVSAAAGNIGFSTRDVHLYYFAVGERTSLTQTIPRQCTDRVQNMVGLTGTITNPPFGTNSALAVAFGGRLTIAQRSTNGDDTYSLETPPSTHDLIVGDVVGGFGSNDVTVASAYVQRDLAVTMAKTVNVDYSTAQLVQTATVDLGLVSSTARTLVSTTLQSAKNTAFQLVSQTTGPFVSEGLATAQASPNDVYDQAIAIDDSGDTVLVENFTSTIANQTYTAPNPLGTATPTVAATTPYPMLNTTWTAYTAAIGYAWQGTQQLSGTPCGGAGQACFVTWSIDVSPGYTGGSPEADMPDLSMLTGWDARLQYVAGNAVNGTVTADTSNAGSADFPEPALAPAGTQRTNVGTSWTITP